MPLKEEKRKEINIGSLCRPKTPLDLGVFLLAYPNGSCHDLASKRIGRLSAGEHQRYVQARHTKFGRRTGHFDQAYGGSAQ